MAKNSTRKYDICPTRWQYGYQPKHLTANTLTEALAIAKKELNQHPYPACVIETWGKPIPIETPGYTEDGRFVSTPTGKTLREMERIGVVIQSRIEWPETGQKTKYATIWIPDKGKIRRL